MNCPQCGSTQTRVTDTRSSADSVRRRRECMTCGQRWSTVEKQLAPAKAKRSKQAKRLNVARVALANTLRLIDVCLEDEND